MTKIYLKGDGRIGNQLWRWARADFLIANRRDRADVELWLHCPELEGMLWLPGTRFTDGTHRGFKKVRPEEMFSCTGNCFCELEVSDTYVNAVCGQQLKKAEFSISVTNRVSSIITCDQNFVGVHIRYGDYRPIGDPHVTAFRRAPNEYFTNLLKIALVSGSGTGLYMASDGTPEELAWFRERYSYPLRPKEHATVDLLALSRCRVIIGSDSSFTRAAAAIGDIPFTVPEMGFEQAAEIVRKALV